MSETMEKIMMGIVYILMAIALAIVFGSLIILGYQVITYHSPTPQENIACKTPRLIADTPDAKLYVVRPNGCDSKPVYFSSSGTQQEQCHLVGKIMRCEQVIIPNNRK